MQEHAYYEAGRRRTFQEMRQKQTYRDNFFNVRQDKQGYRPTSVATEFVDTDWDEDDIISEPEDNSPRVSLQSVSSNDYAPSHQWRIN
jgi:hypothetical protein